MRQGTGRGVLIDTVAPGDPLPDTHLQAMELLRDASHVRNYTGAQLPGRAMDRSDVACAPRGHRPDRTQARVGFPIEDRPHAHAGAHGDAIRSLQDRAPAAVRDHFAVAAQGSFTLDTVILIVAPA